MTGALTAYDTGSGPQEIDCFDTGPNIAGFSILAAHTAGVETDTWTQSFSSTTTVTFECVRSGASEPVNMGYGSLTAVKVAALG